MSSWNSATFEAFVPPQVEGIISLAEDIITYTTKALQFVADKLDAAQSFLSLINIVDLAAQLREQIKIVKNDFSLAGFYFCNMLDYPARQLRRRAGYGPEWDISRLNLTGQPFATSFIADLAGSFSDMFDPKRPQFRGDCAMLVLVTGAADFPSLNLDMGEDNIYSSMVGLGGAAMNMLRAVRRLRIRNGLHNARVWLATASSTKEVAARVKRASKAMMIFDQLTDSELDCLNLPFDPISGRYFYDVPMSAMDWDTQVEPLLTSIEDLYKLSTYPNWTSKSMCDWVPEYVDLVNTVFDLILSLFQSGVNIVSQLKLLISAIQAKINFLLNFIGQVDKVLEALDRFLHNRGFYALFLQATSGIEELVAKLQAAENVPFSGNGFYTGFALVTGGPQVTVFNKLLSPIAQ